MNLCAKDLGLRDSYFDSPHGLMNRFNYSTVADMAKLTHVLMQIPLFRKVVSTHKIQTKYKESMFQNKAMYKWTNTNKLLGYKLDPETDELV
jgi:serine-type D-Ala-D-Ala carboxypeptidase (penicillin-binding protein 5/6)